MQTSPTENSKVLKEEKGRWVMAKGIPGEPVLHNKAQQWTQQSRFDLMVFIGNAVIRQYSTCHHNVVIDNINVALWKQKDQEVHPKETACYLGSTAQNQGSKVYFRSWKEPSLGWKVGKHKMLRNDAGAANVTQIVEFRGAESKLGDLLKVIHIISCRSYKSKFI